MSFHPRRTLVRALTVSLLAHACLLFGVAGTLPERADAPMLMRVVAMSRSGGVGEDAPAAEEAATAPAGAPPAQAAEEALPFPVDTPPPAQAAEEAPPLVADTPPAPVEEAPPVSSEKIALTDPVETPAPVVAVKSRGHAPVRPKSGAVARKPADSLAKEAASPAAPSSPAVATAASSLAATPADAGSSPGGGTRGEAAAAPSGVAPARQGEVCADGDVRRYRAALAISAERLKRYPPLARERAWEGRVEIALDFRPGEPALSLAASSGHGILDEQALETLRQAVRQTEPPTGLKGRDCRIRQALTFSLVE